MTTLMMLATTQGAAPVPANPETNGGNYKITGPFVHDNLAVFLVHGADRLKNKSYLTLQEAMEKKIVIVHETGNVNELTIENISPD
jgi:hypothetical protein